jgi:LmbE family N-acetylglucosaminyl deacetylase
VKPHQRLLVISPHLDDAVLSCGLVLAANPAAVVCTVFTAPPRENTLTDWDRASGFADAFEAMNARKAEDVRALTLVGARAVHLPFRDAQYHSSPSHDSLVAALGRAFAALEPTTALIPLGLFHSDHLLVAQACLALMQRFRDVPVFAYEDVPYRNMPGVVQTRLSKLTEPGYQAVPTHDFDTDPGLLHDHQQMKQAAIGAYRGQLRAFGSDGQPGLVSPERYWRLHDTAGAEAGCGRDDGYNACVSRSSPH